MKNSIIEIVATIDNYNNWIEKGSYNLFMQQIKNTIDSINNIPDKNILSENSLDDFLKKIGAFNDQKIRKKVINIIINNYEIIEIKIPNDKISEKTLLNYIENFSIVDNLDKKICLITNSSLKEEIDITGDVERLKFLEISNIKQLHCLLIQYPDKIINFAQKWMGNTINKTYKRGISLFYLEYFLVGKKDDPKLANNYTIRFISEVDKSSKHILKTYKSII